MFSKMSVRLFAVASFVALVAFAQEGTDSCFDGGLSCCKSINADDQGVGSGVGCSTIDYPEECSKVLACCDDVNGDSGTNCFSL
ncbi:uncharacterized protein EDB91DRAFT_219802 [Suillus paluster]|uniref:uncharacterized protein n=1 Tax=Suillus paluster TaxID=48578 RepID=UPI001B85EDC7|nr:uncharacterized protein EDB91DRAFT_219802 [Suillus paluster]KAG1743646.1 hypothetical protein EDB91DRAFT_219802 [Suillus paluster]